jgi:hypothetical protein
VASRPGHRDAISRGRLDEKALDATAHPLGVRGGGGFPAENPAANANIPRCGPAVWTRGDAGPRVASTRASRRARPRVFG